MRDWAAAIGAVAGGRSGGAGRGPRPGAARGRTRAEGRRAREALALLGLLALAACGGAGAPLDGDLAPDGEPAALAEEASLARSAVDEAELRLDGEGGEDDDTAMEEALAAHGLGVPAVGLLRAEALKGLLLETARAAPAADAGTLVQRTLDRWHALAGGDPPARLAALGDLAGFDPGAPPVRISPGAAEAAARAPERGLDARGRRQLADARARVAEAVSAHLDLTPGEAAGALGPIAARAADDGAAAARAFAGTLAASPRDAARAAARALRRSWQSLTDRAFDDQAWPAVAALLGRAQPMPPAPAPPAFSLLDGAGLACAALPGGLACDGASSGAALRLSIDGAEVAAPLAPDTAATEALLRLRARLPAGVAGCASGRTASYLRLDRTAPSLEGTPLESVAIARSQPATRPHPVGPPAELVVRGRFRTDGLRPAFLVEYSGCELRVQLIAQPMRGAGRGFEARLALSSRLPDRDWEALLADERGRTLAAESL